MKKTIIALMALASVASAASVEYKELSESLKNGVICAYDFSSNSVLTGTALSGMSHNEDGTCTIGKASGQCNAYNTNLPTSSTNSFTLSFDLYALTIKDSRTNAIITMYSGGSKAQYENAMAIVGQSDGKIQLQNGQRKNNQVNYIGTNSVDIIDSGLTSSTLTGNTITLVSDGAEKLLTLYVDGNYVGKIEQWKNSDDVTPILTGMQLGSYFSGWDEVGSAKIDNLTVWNRALSSNEVKALIVPEPTTATLSLLALAGLAARRRRK